MDSSILSRLLLLSPSNAGMELPPKVFLNMQGEFIEFVKGEKLVARFPNLERYLNPFGFMQGGIIVAAIDNTVSPLSYVTAPANITKEINTSFKRPIKESDDYIQVIATIIKQTATHITLHADVLNAKGKLATTALTNCVFIKGNR